MGKKAQIKRGKVRPDFSHLIRRHCVPLHAIAVDDNLNGGLNITGGTALLWETICGRFYVTAYHVWEKLAELTQGPSPDYHFFTYDLLGPIRIYHPRLIDASEELDLAVFTALGIMDGDPTGKSFLQTHIWPPAPAKSGDMIVGCGYPGDMRMFFKGHWEQNILIWANRKCTVSESGERILLYAEPGKGQAAYFTRTEPQGLSLPGISGAPLFALRDTLDWVGVVRSGVGELLNGFSIQATPSGFLHPDGRIRKI